MPKRTNPFQHLVALIETTAQIDGATVIESEELEDRITKEFREVDIVIHVKKPYPFMIGIECKGGESKPRPASVEWVEQMWGKHASLPTDKLVLVSKAGFTIAAITKATWLQIECLSLTHPETSNWRAKIRDLSSLKVVHFLLPYLTRANLVFDLESEGVPTDINLENPQLIDVEDKPIDANDLIKGWVNDPAMIAHLEANAFIDADTGFSFERTLKPGIRVLGTSGNKYPVMAINVEGRCRKVIEEIPLKQASYGQVAIAHGVTNQFGNDMQIVITEKLGEAPIFVTSAEKRTISGKTNTNR